MPGRRVGGVSSRLALFITVAGLASSVTGCIGEAFGQQAYDVLELKSGETVVGVIEGLEDGAYQLVLADGTSLSVPLGDVLELRAMPAETVEEHDVTAKVPRTAIESDPSLLTSSVRGGEWQLGSTSGVYLNWTVPSAARISKAGVRTGINPAFNPAGGQPQFFLGGAADWGDGRSHLRSSLALTWTAYELPNPPRDHPAGPLGVAAGLSWERGLSNRWGLGAGGWFYVSLDDALWGVVPDLHVRREF
jgi:hypothetical protein